MTDLHTHILPGVDDGARDVQMSISMLRMEREQSVSTVVLSPHFYSDRENVDQFLQRRSVAFQALQSALGQLPAQERETLPRLVLGAEVAWRSDLVECEQLTELCIGTTNNLLLELPFTPWSNRLFDQLYDLMGCAGVTPVIAHLDRYLGLQRPRYIQEVLELGVPVQISAEILLHPFVRGKALKMLRCNQAHLLVSDCHDTGDRAPNLHKGMEIVRRKLGEQRAQELILCADELANE